MRSNSAETVTGPKRESELSRLIRSFTETRNAGNSTEALRLIDRAWRLAPDNPEINFLYGRLLLSQKAFEQAAKLLAKAAAGRRHPEYEAAYIVALCSNGDLERARAIASQALTQFMVTPDGPLAAAARQVAAASEDVPGWIGIGPDMVLHGEIVGTAPTAKLEIAGDSFPPYTRRITRARDAAFSPFAVPAETVAPGHMTARVQDTVLLGGKLDYPPDFGLDGRVRLSRGILSGWVSMRWDPVRQLTLTLSDENGFSTILKPQPDQTQIDRQLFSLPLASCGKLGNALTIRATLPDDSLMELPVSPFLIRPSPAPGVVAAPNPGPVSSTADSFHGAEPRAIDIVIPVYSGVDDTLTCIRSVIATAGSKAEIVVINDASPDQDMAAELEALAASGEITLLKNHRNLGFPATVHRGMTLHPDRDVVLLNADTELYGDWLARLRGAAYKEPRIASATPLTNSGSIASYPKTEEPELPSDTAAARDRLAARTNQGVTIEIPTGVGFCMYIRRDAMDEVGSFDDQLFAKGYGEENDFCLRAAKAGWKHVLAADIYVRHAGSRSFGGRRAALTDRNLRLLNLRYPGYDAAIRNYLDRDPAHIARRRLDEARLASTPCRYALVVSLALGGGVFRAVQERSEALHKQGITPLLLTPDEEDDGVCVLTTGESGFDDLRYESATETGALLSLLRGLDIEHVELHHFLDLPPELIESLFTLGRPVDVTVHDYVWYCPRITLLNRSKRYCGEPDTETCQACIDRNGARLKEKITVSALRQRSRRWLGLARGVSVPSPSVAQRMAAQFPDITFRVEPLEADIPAPVASAPKARGTALKVALLGAIGDHKGYKTLLAMAEHAAKHTLPLDFVVIGFTKDDHKLMNTGKVFVTGRYREAEIPELIKREAPDVILFLSHFPESWCYSLTHALHAQIPVAALALGAIADRLRGSPADRLLFPTSLGPEDICDRLLQAFHPPLSKEENEINLLVRQNGSSRLPRKPDNLATAPVLPEPGTSLRTIMAPNSTEPTASVSFLPLNRGLYLFSVRSDHSSRQSGEQITLPAMQIAAAPGTPAGQVEFMMGASAVNGWLIDWNDQIIAKVTGPSVLVSLTSVLIPGMTPLEIEVQRLDQARSESEELPAPPARKELSPLSPAAQSIPLEVIAHIQNRGDTTFREAQWAGLPEQGLWIESVAVLPREGITADMIEYKAITATGVETPWVTGGAPCGTRGIGVPITGFALRVKPQPGAPQLTCEYGAACLSGATIGPVRNGVPCYSADARDPITALWVSISGTIPAAAEKKAQPAEKAEKPANAAAKRPASTDASSPKSKKAKIGPRFSVFREPTPPEHE